MVDDDGPWDALLAHLERTTRLDRAEAAKVVRETLAYFSEPLADFVIRRHRELKARDLRNEHIYRRIADEVRERRFVVPPLSERQIRRLVYG